MEGHESAGKKSFGRSLNSLLEVVSKIGGSTIVVMATAAGFLLGAVTLGAFSLGLGIPVLDLGLDLQGYVTVAAGTLILPITFILLTVIFDQIAPESSDLVFFGYVVLLMPLLIAGLLVLLFGTVPLSWGWGWGIAIWVAMLILVILGGLGPAEALDDPSDPIYYTLLGVSGLLVSLLLAFGFGYVWGLEVRNGGADELNGPLTLELVAPATRGTISVDGRTACVDRVGSNVVFGSDGSALLTDWEWFKHDRSCERDPVSGLLRER